MQTIQTLFQKTQNKKLLVIFPHPDDETVMAAGLLQQAVTDGWEVKVVCVTNGSLGQIHVHGQGRSIVQIRKQELSKAMNLLGVKDFELWRFGDGSLAEFDGWKQEVNALIADYKPGVVVSYGPDGVSGHPDHLSLGNYIYKYWIKKTSYELLWPAFTGETLAYLQNKVKTKDRFVEPTYHLSMNQQQATVKKQALLAHQSQNLENPLRWLEVDPSEFYAVPKPNTKYNYELVEFDLGV